MLDDLTARFIANGWSLKWLHREIMLSAAYRQASAPRRDASTPIDPDNRWLWRMNRRRLEVEAWRDAMLAVTGTLSPERGGPPRTWATPNNRRRTLYGTVKRRELTDLLRLHDFPDPTTHSPGRVPTTTPLQQLFVLNSPFMRQQAAALARAAEDGSARAGTRRGCAGRTCLLYGRPATEQRRSSWRMEFLRRTGRSDAAWSSTPRCCWGATSSCSSIELRENVKAERQAAIRCGGLCPPFAGRISDVEYRRDPCQKHTARS